MIIKSKITPENRKRYFTILGACAQLSLALAIFLGRMETTGLDFLIGILYGFSIVGNLAYLYTISKNGLGG
jgi:hypothetical protein